MNVIEIKNISKTYPGSNKKANNNITLDLRKGEILCIAGENGAGKTTLMKILCGLEKQDSGELFIKEKTGMVHQHFMLIPEYTAAENIVMGIEPLKFGIFFDKDRANKISDKLFTDNNFSFDIKRKVKELTLGEMQQVEISRILYQNADIIILDEPTSILTEYEIESLFKTLKDLVNKGKSIILITHKLHEIKQIADRVAVIKQGELVGIHDISEVDVEEIARLMVNNDINLTFSKSSSSIVPMCEKKTVLAFDNVTVRRRGQKHPILDKVSFSVSSGEILGFAGVGGNGLGIIEAVLGGFLHPASGKILHKGKDISGLNIHALRKQGLTYVPADRIRVGSASDATIEENLIINRRHEYFKNFTTDKTNTANIIENYNIEFESLRDKTSTLSGGNLQKLILAREINWFKDYIVFSQPTWGLDIASSRFIMEEIDKLRKKGAAIIIISTNLDEIIELSDRIIVMYRGRVAGEFKNDRDNAIKEKIGKYMQGVKLSTVSNGVDE